MATAEIANTEDSSSGTMAAGTSTDASAEAVTDKPQLQDALEQNPDIKLVPRSLDVQGSDDSASESKLSAPVEILLSFLSQFYLNESHSALIPDEVVVDFAAAEKDTDDQPDEAEAPSDAENVDEQLASSETAEPTAGRDPS